MRSRASLAINVTRKRRGARARHIAILQSYSDIFKHYTYIYTQSVVRPRLKTLRLKASIIILPHMDKLLYKTNTLYVWRQKYYCQTGEIISIKCLKINHLRLHQSELDTTGLLFEL